MGIDDRIGMPKWIRKLREESLGNFHVSGNTNNEKPWA
jgi:hypothetical protein